MAGVPTFTTLRDIADIAVQFSNDVSSGRAAAQDRMARANRYIKIQDPDFPEDPTKRIWHPNMTSFYTPDQLVVVQRLYDHLKADYDFWEQFVVTDAATTESLFDVQPKLDALVTAGLSALMQG